MLERILAGTRAALAQRKERVPVEELERRLQDGPPTRDLAAALREPGVSIIAEIKRASPSRGPLNLGLDPAGLALQYARAGAVALSVLTEEAHFRGALADLVSVRAGLGQAGLACPVLRKDFVIDPYQLLEARVAGADAVLLIVAALDDATLHGLHQRAGGLALSVLVEVHSEEELRRALALEPDLVGINNRNLVDFTVNLARTEELRPLIPRGCVVVSESGVRSPCDVRRLAAVGVDAVLVGEALVTSEDPASTLRTLREAGAT